MSQTPKFNPKKWLATIMLGQSPDQQPASEEEWKALQQAALQNGVTALCHDQLATMTAPPQCPDWFRQALKKHTLSIAHPGYRGRTSLPFKTRLKAQLTPWKVPDV